MLSAEPLLVLLNIVGSVIIHTDKTSQCNISTFKWPIYFPYSLLCNLHKRYHGESILLKVLFYICSIARLFMERTAMKEVFVQKQHFAVYVMNSNKVKSELKSCTYRERIHLIHFKIEDNKKKRTDEKKKLSRGQALAS